MTKFLAKIGRFYAMVITSVIFTAAVLTLTMSAAMLLDQYGFDIRLDLVMAFTAGVSLVVAPPVSWVMVGQMLLIYHMEEEMRSLASSDSLTGLLNRRAFFENANSYVSLANRECTDFSVIVIDLDHFKSINDQYGHLAGDAVLQLFADVVNSVARRSDIIGRLGGEEFAIVLPSTGADEAREFSERLHDATGKAVLKYRSSAIHYSISMGSTSSSSSKSDDIIELLTQADIALYQAKREGRNRTVVFDPTVDRTAVS